MCCVCAAENLRKPPNCRFVNDVGEHFFFTFFIQSILIHSTDTCGVHNLHGMPAVFSALCSAIFAYFATSQAYGDSLHTIFPAMKNASMIEEEGVEFVIGVS